MDVAPLLGRLRGRLPARGDRGAIGDDGAVAAFRQEDINDLYPVTSEGSASVFLKRTFSSSTSAKKDEGVSFRAERISKRLATEGEVRLRSTWKIAPLVRPACSARSPASPLIWRSCLILAPMSITGLFFKPSV